MTKKKTAVKAPAFEAPQTRDDCDRLIRRIGECQRERTILEARMNEEMAAVKARFEALAEPHAAEIAAATRGVHAFCEAHRQELTAGKSKTVRLAAGEVAWRTTPPKVMVRTVEKVLASLKALGLHHFIRVKEEVDKEAMLRDREAAAAVAGVTISQREEFVVKPFATELEEVAL